MSERLLCDSGLRVSLDGGGDRTLLAVQDGTTVRFWAQTTDMEGTLRGTPLQVSAFGGYCYLEVSGETARLEFGVTGDGRKRCTFPRTDLEDALAWVRGLESPHGMPEGAIDVTGGPP